MLISLHDDECKDLWLNVVLKITRVRNEVDDGLIEQRNGELVNECVLKNEVHVAVFLDVAFLK